MSVNRTSWLLFSLMIGLAIAIIIIVFLIQQTRQKDQDIADLEQKINLINRNLVEQQRIHLSTAELFRLLDSEAYKKVKLASVTGKPQAKPWCSGMLLLKKYL